MHDALLKLGYLRAKAVLRSLLRGARRPRGLVYLVIGGFVLGSWICGSLGSLVVSNFGRSGTPTWLPMAVPLFLLAYTVSCLLQLRAGVITFTPAEIDFLFPGPFSRRELLTFKLAGKLLGTLFSALFVGLALQRQVHSFWTLYPGLVLMLVFVQLVQIVISMAGLVVGQRVQRWGRLAIIGGLLAAGGLIVAQTPPLPESLNDMPAWAEQLSSTMGVRVLLAPFEVFSQAMIAPNGYPAALVWLALAAAIDLALLLSVFALDANYLESSLVASEQRYAALERAKQGRRLAAVRPAHRLGRIPQVSWWGGAGPTFWRQTTTALRTGKLIWLLPPVLFGVTLLLGLYNPNLAAGVGGSVSVYLLFILLATVRYDFRGDIDNIPWLKTLPIGALGLAAGELLTPVAIVSLTLWGALVGMGIAVPEARLPATAAMGFVPFAALLLCGVENAFFLLFPSRSMIFNLGDLQSVGRFIVIMFCKGLVFAALLLTAGLSGAAAYFACGESLIAGGVAIWLVTAAAALATVPLVAWAFTRFDPGVDTPA